MTPVDNKDLGFDPNVYDISPVEVGYRRALANALEGVLDQGWFIGRRFALLFLPFALACAVGPIFAQAVLPVQETMEATTRLYQLPPVQERLQSATRILEEDPRFKTISPQRRQHVFEFVTGNTFFVLLHELGHATISEFNIGVLGKEEDAADSFAATQLIGLGTAVSEEAVVNSAKGWFMSDRRDKAEGDDVPFYDVHGLDQQRAFQFVCFLVGADEKKFKSLADEVKLPKDRQTSCRADYTRATKAWDQALRPHARAPDQPKTKIDVVYGEVKGKFGGIAQAVRAMKLLEVIANRASDRLAWPTPFSLEMQTCGFINAAWMASTHKLTFCYELATDFAELYRDYGDEAPPKSKKRKHK